MTSPQSYVMQVLNENLRGWKIRHGDRPLDGQLNANTVVVYAEEISNKNTIRSGLLDNALKAIVFTRETAIDKQEDALFDALQDVLFVLNKETATLTWTTARRGIWDNRPGYEISLNIVTTMKEDEE